MGDNWPFKDERELPVLTTNEVLRGTSPIMYVSHDQDDGCWQFFGKSGADEAQVKVVTLEEIFSLDPSIGQLSDLPLGWGAERESHDDEWVRTEN